MKLCSKCGCKRGQAHATWRGMCKPCGKKRYRQWTVKRVAECPSPAASKCCAQCLVEKEGTKFHVNSFSPDGLSNKCKRCKKFNQIYRKYGLDEKAYLALFTEQENKCLICTRVLAFEDRAAHVDHDDCPGYKNLSPGLKAERSAGTGKTCVWWALFNAYEALLRGVVDTDAVDWRNSLPASWRNWYQKEKAYTCYGVSIKNAVLKLQCMGIASSGFLGDVVASAAPCYDSASDHFLRPISGKELIAIHGMDGAPDTHRGRLMRSIEIFISKNLAERNLFWDQMRNPGVLGRDFVIVINVRNSVQYNRYPHDERAYPLGTEELATDVAQWLSDIEKNGVVIDSTRTRQKKGEPGHAMIVYGIRDTRRQEATGSYYSFGAGSDNKTLLLWDTAKRIPTLGVQSQKFLKDYVDVQINSSKRRLQLDRIADDKVTIEEWYFIGLNAKGALARDGSFYRKQKLKQVRFDPARFHFHDQGAAKRKQEA